MGPSAKQWVLMNACECPCNTAGNACCCAGVAQHTPHLLQAVCDLFRLFSFPCKEEAGRTLTAFHSIEPYSGPRDAASSMRAPTALNHGQPVKSIDRVNTRCMFRQTATATGWRAGGIKSIQPRMPHLQGGAHTPCLQHGPQPPTPPWPPACMPHPYPRCPTAKNAACCCGYSRGIPRRPCSYKEPS